MSTMDKWGPRGGSIRDPRDNKKKSGMFWNWPRYLYFGGKAQGVTGNQHGEVDPKLGTQNGNKHGQIVGPISDRGKGR